MSAPVSDVSGSKAAKAAAPWLRGWMRVSTRFLPFADAATAELPLPRLVRLGLFQGSVAMATTLLAGTLNRVMIVELGVSATLVAIMVSLPLVIAPLRALIGFRSDVYQSVLGWKRVPFIWFGSLMQFGGLAIMPFALILLSGDTNGSAAAARFIAALAFLLVGAGAHTTQTAGLALATDLAPERVRPRVVALLYVILLVGMFVSALTFGRLLANFSQLRLIQIIQGAAVVTMVLNVVALWKQEPRMPRGAKVAAEARPRFIDAWRAIAQGGRAVRLLVAVALGTAAFGMQDILLEPFGGQVLRLGVGATTTLTALMSAGALAAFAISARMLERGTDPLRLAAGGVATGVLAFSLVLFAAPFDSAGIFRAGTTAIGFGSGLFAVGTMIAVMALRDRAQNGLALGAWGAVQATAGGVAVAIGGALRDGVARLASEGALIGAMRTPAAAYSVVYGVELALLFATFVALGPLVAPIGTRRSTPGPARIGLADLPG